MWVCMSVVFIVSQVKVKTILNETDYRKKGEIQIDDVVSIAAIVPRGIENCAFFKFPDRFDPAIIPTDRIENELKS